VNTYRNFIGLLLEYRYYLDSVFPFFDSAFIWIIYLAGRKGRRIAGSVSGSEPVGVTGFVDRKDSEVYK